MRMWELLVEESRRHFNQGYDRLGVLLTDDGLAGESTYNDSLAAVASELADLGLARRGNGALCRFPPGVPGRGGNPRAWNVRKSDGAVGHARPARAAPA